MAIKTFFKILFDYIFIKYEKEVVNTTKSNIMEPSCRKTILDSIRR